MTSLPRILLLAATAALLIAPEARAGEGERGQRVRRGGGARLARLFHQHDADGDGRLTADEMPDRLAARLDALDRDGDGALSLGEIRSALAQHHRGRADDAPGRRFQALDQDGDGRLTADEVPAHLWDRLARADADGDGAVTLGEIQSARQQRRGDRGDGEKRGPITPRERGDEGRGREGRAPGRIFQRLDGNGDGRLTADEVPARLWERLVQADADGDGAVTLGEIQSRRHGRGRR